jgi:hypothetical protein
MSGAIFCRAKLAMLSFFALGAKGNSANCVEVGKILADDAGAGAVTSCEFLVSSWSDGNQKSEVGGQKSEILVRVAGSLETEREGSEVTLRWLLISRAQLGAGWTACATQGAEAAATAGCLHVSEARA